MIHPNGAMRRQFDPCVEPRAAYPARLAPACGWRASVVDGVIASGSTLTWMIAGLPDCLRGLERSREVGGLLHRAPKPPNAFA